jgi:hypothetical protein
MATPREVMAAADRQSTKVQTRSQEPGFRDEAARTCLTLTQLHFTRQARLGAIGGNVPVVCPRIVSSSYQIGTWQLGPRKGSRQRKGDGQLVIHCIVVEGEMIDRYTPAANYLRQIRSTAPNQRAPRSGPGFGEFVKMMLSTDSQARTQTESGYRSAMAFLTASRHSALR